MEDPDADDSSFEESSQSDSSSAYDNPPPRGSRTVATDDAGVNSSGGWGIQGNPVSDASTASDTLGFAPYVDAVAAFLIHSDTTPPLTLSIEGEWGTGKSSFMRQLQVALDKVPEAKTRVGRVVRRILAALRLTNQPDRLTFWFNAWRHDTRDAMWATFALSITRNLRNSQSLPRRIRGDIHLAARRVNSFTDWLRVLFIFLVILALGIGAAGVAAYPFTLSAEKRADIAKKVFSSLWQSNGIKDEGKKAEPSGTPSEGLAQPAASKSSFVSDQIAGNSAAHPLFAMVFLLAAYGYWIRRSAGKSMEFKLERYLSKPDYESRVSFVETFHEDFKKVVQAYAGKRKVFIFVDDLDRTDVPKSAELMQAINLMIGDDPHLVFILGIDREKVAAGISLKFKDIQPLLDRTREGEVSARHPAAFGYLYLEKFIQVTFRVPRPSDAGVQEFLDSLANRTSQKKSQEARKQAEHEQREERRRYVDVRSSADSVEVQTLVRMVAPALQWNPRRMKQFINDFRLQAYIASDLGLLDLVSMVNGAERARITLEQLGKFVAITMAWPDLVMDFVEFPELLSAIYAADPYVLDKFVVGRDTLQVITDGVTNEVHLNADRKELLKRWSGEQTLMALLKARSEGEDGGRYSLEQVDLRVLLNISPKVQRASAQARASVEAPSAAGEAEEAAYEQASIDTEESRFTPL
ncbi:MAG TPA: P-loop NTPase fold protein [Terracidiphilus sp.]|jgi:hypothetical protein